MNGRRLVKKTMRTLIIAIIWIGLFVAVGVVTYKLTLAYYKGTGQYAAATDSKTIAKATLDSVAVNAVFAVDGDDGKVKHILLEIFHSQTGKLDFVTVPVESQYGMGKELFTTLSKENPNVPQILSFEDLPQYFSQATAYQYASLLLEESLGIHVSFYTLMPVAEFAVYFEENKTNSIDGQDIASAYALNETTRNKIKGLTTTLQMEAELASYYTKVQSNLSLSRRYNYLSAYLKANYDNIGSYALSATTELGQFTEQDREWIMQLVKE